MNNDRQRLAELQENYINGSANALAGMYEILQEIALKVINKQGEKNAFIKNLSVDERRQKAHNAATSVIEQYLKKPGFKITGSIPGYLYRCVLFELYHVRHCDTLLVFEEPPAEAPAKKRYIYTVRNEAAEIRESYETGQELFLKYKRLTKKILAECIKTGRPWKGLFFDLLEI